MSTAKSADCSSTPAPQRLLDLRRTPVLTAALVVVTAVVSVAGLLSPPLLAALQRAPAGLHGQAWRWVTSLLVQDGGVFGTVSNLAFLLVIGAAAEQVLPRRAMLGLYLTAGLVGQAAGYLWQPFGAGNSVAICGLAGALAWTLHRHDVPRWTSTALALWLGALLATWWAPLIAVGISGAVLDRCITLRPTRRRMLLVGATATTAAALTAAANVHGPALALGVLVGALPAIRCSGASTPAA
jgi:membrane associated rhomboid family serine protease